MLERLIIIRTFISCQNGLYNIKQTAVIPGVRTSCALKTSVIDLIDKRVHPSVENPSA